MSKPKPAKPTTPKPTKTRDGKGRFVPGNPGGPGRPPAEREDNYLRAAREEISPPEFRQLFRRVFIRAMAGSVQASRLIFDHLLPRPGERVGIEQNFFGDVSHAEFRIAGASTEEINAMMIAELASMLDEPTMLAIAQIRRESQAEKLPNGQQLVTGLVTSLPNGHSH